MLTAGPAGPAGPAGHGGHGGHGDSVPPLREHALTSPGTVRGKEYAARVAFTTRRAGAPGPSAPPCVPL
ncbi:hypothetical protein NFX46_24690 [Streptomyces phaeoluteigriseus]|uniref:Uncharacterized protein n=1 Tax=Streptomyces phaeoluteigriseus TaxID=114686 RepID=A0ABY4ZC77_9ACTN|nr:hypothetical protein [Streptomyces phaeoluteigriseus]USQ86619.1 hypothetical protein NFX46_24690 [Streptomyces phaeoluteigriseus]